MSNEEMEKKMEKEIGFMQKLMPFFFSKNGKTYIGNREDERAIRADGFCLSLEKALLKYKLSILDEVEKRLPEASKDKTDICDCGREIEFSGYGYNEYRQQVLTLLSDLRKEIN